MDAKISFSIGAWSHSVVVHNCDDPEAFVARELHRDSLLAMVLTERFGIPSNTRRDLDRMRKAKKVKC